MIVLYLTIAFLLYASYKPRHEENHWYQGSIGQDIWNEGFMRRKPNSRDEDRQGQNR